MKTKKRMKMALDGLCACGRIAGHSGRHVGKKSAGKPRSGAEIRRSREKADALAKANAAGDFFTNDFFEKVVEIGALEDALDDAWLAAGPFDVGGARGRRVAALELYRRGVRMVKA